MQWTKLIGAALGVFSSHPDYWQFHRQMDRNWEVDDEEVDRQVRSIPTHYAFAPFYINSNGSNLNAGSTAVDAGGLDTPLVTDVGGTYNQGTGAGGTDQYVASAGTPFSATVVGEYISVYTAAASVTTFVGQITAINASGGSVDVSLTIIYGTRPANASTKTAKTGGAWADFTVVTAGPMTTAIAQATKVNIRGSSTNSYTTTYANTTTSRTFSCAGTVLLPLWWSGYNNVPGDLDTSPTSTRTPGTNMPSITFTTGQFAVSGTNNWFSSLDIQGAQTASASGQVNVTGGRFMMWRCRVTATGANANSNAITAASGVNGCWLIDCYFSANASATQVVKCGASAPTYILGCTITGGGIGSTLNTAVITISKTQFISCGSHCIQSTSTAQAWIDGCSAYNSANASDFYNITTAVPTYAVVTNNVLWGFANGINNTVATNSSNVFRCNNSMPVAGGANLTGSREVGFGDFPEFDPITETALPFVSATNLQLLSSSAAYQHAAPGLFENSLSRGFDSAGAVQPQGGITDFFLAVKAT